jgi:hypothetical protein
MILHCTKRGKWGMEEEVKDYIIYDQSISLQDANIDKI